MIGQLKGQPLVELIRDLYSQRRGGVLRLKHDAVRIVIYFEAGNIIYAAANLRELRLAEYVRRQNLLAEDQLQDLENNLSDLSLAASLTERGQLDQQVVLKLITKQVVDVLRVVMLWTEGDWEFNDRARLNDPLRVKIDLPGVLLQTARKIEPKIISARLANRDEIFSPVAELPDSTALLPAEGFLLSRLETSSPLRELILISGLPESEVMRIVYGLALAGFVESERWASVTKEEQPADVGAMPPVDQPTESIAAEESVHSLAAELEELLVRLENAPSYYEVLNVEHNATSEDIKNNYYALARRYHPDLFHMQAGTPLHATVESAFAKIAQAYVTLSDLGQRTAYDAKLAAKERVRRAAAEAPQPSQRDRARAEAAKRQQEKDAVVDNDAARAETSFQEGFVALQQGQTRAAIISLAVAARLAPTEARFRAYYGRALAGAIETRRLAESELQAALKLDPENLSYRLMLAELYFDLGFFRRAEGELKRVMTVEPNNPGGLNLLRRLEATTT